MAIKSVIKLVAADVVDGGRKRNVRPVIGLWSSSIGWIWRRAIFLLFEEVKRRLYMVWVLGDGDFGLLCKQRAVGSGKLDSCRSHCCFRLNWVDLGQ